jgi:hypothetical protein
MPTQKAVRHDLVSAFQRAGNAVLPTRKIRLPDEIAGHQQPRADPSLVEIAQQLNPFDTGGFRQGDREAEPRRVAAGCRFRQDEELLQVRQSLPKMRKVAFSCRDQIADATQLGKRHGGLHIGDLQVVAGVRVDVLVVVTAWQFSELPFIALAAGVVATRRAIAVTAPVAERLDQLRQLRIVSEDGAAFAHGDVMRGVEAQGADMAEGADLAVAIGAAEGIAAIFHQPESVMIGKRSHFFDREGDSQRVGEHDGARLRANGGSDRGKRRVVAGRCGIDEDRYQAILQNGVDRCRETRRSGNDLIARLQGTCAKLW